MPHIVVRGNTAERRRKDDSDDDGKSIMHKLPAGHISVSDTARNKQPTHATSIAHAPTLYIQYEDTEVRRRLIMTGSGGSREPI
jgi:hypothetical protein